MVVIKQYSTPRGSCGRKFCPAIIRMIWHSPDVPARHASKVWVGISMSEMRRRADIIGLSTQSRSGRKYVSVSAKRLTQAWLDQTINLAAAAASVGLDVRVFQKRAIGLGLSPRKVGQAPKPLPDDFRDMWEAGVCSRELAAICGLCRQSITYRARVSKLPKRPRSHRAIKLSEYRRLVIMRDMAATARQENLALRQAQHPM